jgi:hypothetical protein
VALSADLQNLLGCWLLVTGQQTVDAGDRVEMQFKPSGELVYAVHEAQKWQLVLLTFKLEGKTIVSNQPSKPREARTEFSFPAPNQLKLNHFGDITSFKRLTDCTFPRGS